MQYRKLRSACLSALLLIICAVSLIVHFRIYKHTSASVFINHPVFYYNRFCIRESNGQTRDVSLQVGFWSYITAALSVGSICWGLMRIFISAKKREAAVRLGA